MKTSTAINGPESMENAVNGVTPYEAKITFHDFTETISHLQGELLTIVEASTTDIKQREAVKSLVKNALWKTQGKVGDWYYNQDEQRASSFPFNNTPSTF